MKMRLSQILILFLCLFSQIGSVAAQSIAPKKFQGFLGTYHPFKGTAYGGSGFADGELMQKAFDFGANAIVSHASYNGYTFKENVENNCREWDVNKLYGILIPPSEKGVVNQPNDTELLKPLGRFPGMIQAAHRFSEVSKQCAQLSGAIIDDFYHDFPKTITADELRDIKDALLGKRVDEKGNVDHSSPSTTPHLKLYAVVYEHQIDRFNKLGQSDKTALDLVDGISFWIWKQNQNHKKFGDYLETIRKDYPNKEILRGIYIFNSAETPTPESIHYMFEQAVNEYAEGKINSLILFSAIWLSREKISPQRWKELDIPTLLNRTYYPFLGEGRGRVIDAKSKLPIKNALVTVSRFVNGKSLLTARKFTDERGEYRFGGWAGRNKKERVDYEIKIESDSLRTRTMSVRLRAGEDIKFADARLKK